MGRNRTGASSIKSIARIELSHLVKDKFLVEGKTLSGTMSWTSGVKIQIISRWTTEEKYLQFIYQCSNSREDWTKDFSYKVELTSIKSNLGKGEVLYLVCPLSGKRCRILYLDYNDLKFKSREAYSKRLYYNCQWQSKYDNWLTRYHDTKKQIEALEKQSYRKTYNNKPTRKALKIKHLKKKLDLYELRKNNIFNWRCGNWGVNLFSMPLMTQKTIINTGNFFFDYPNQNNLSFFR